MKRLWALHDSSFAACEGPQKRNSATSNEPPQSMVDLVERKLSSWKVDSITRAFAEPGTYYGFAAGACTGFALKKVAKAAALTFGVVFVGFQLAAKSEYVSVNWSKIEADVKKYLPEKPEDETSMVTDTVKFLTTNTGIASAVFAGGFLTGLKIG